MAKSPFCVGVGYKGYAPRAADAAGYARARKYLVCNYCETCKGSRKTISMIWCTQIIDNAKSFLYSENYLVLCCVLAVSRSDQQYLCQFRGGENMWTDNYQI